MIEGKVPESHPEQFKITLISRMNFTTKEIAKISYNRI
jgi:hypothetical protein